MHVEDAWQEPHDRGESAAGSRMIAVAEPIDLKRNAICAERSWLVPVRIGTCRSKNAALFKFLFV